METRPLGRTGLTVTAIGLGSQTVGGLGYGHQDQSRSQAVVETYLRGGGRFIDSARGYGTSEIHVGKAIRAVGCDDEVVVCSKTSSLHPPCAAADLDVSRFCLQRDKIDVYYVHVPAPEDERNDRIIDAFCGFRDRGLIGHVGMSCRELSDPAHREQVRRWIADPRVEVIQFPFNFSMPYVAELIAEAHEAGVGAVCRGTVRSGLFDDRLQPGYVVADRDNDGMARFPQEKLDRMLGIVQEIRAAHVAAPFRRVAQLSQRWVLDHPGVSAIIGGGGSIEEVEEMLAVDALPPLPPEIAEDLVARARPIDELARR